MTDNPEIVLQTFHGSPLTAYDLAVKGNSLRSHGVPVDYPVLYTIQDLINGNDKEMDLATRLAIN
jgi:hypothetical protein